MMSLHILPHLCKKSAHVSKQCCSDTDADNGIDVDEEMYQVIK